MLTSNGTGGDRVKGTLSAKKGLVASGKGRCHYKVECFDKHGNLKWVEEFDNLLPDAACNYILDAGVGAGTQITAWYVGLKGAGAAAAADTMASHASWTEVTDYTQATKPAWTKNGAAAGKAISNSSSKAVFDINATVTVAGAFVTSNATKGAATGTLYSVGDFSSSRNLESGDQLQVQVDFQQNSA